MQKIELLSPAKDLDSGKTAIDSGADAVYIGGPRYGARAAASNTLEDIRQLAEYAHLFHARAYVTLNTLLENNELEGAVDLVHRVWQAGADALIIQDMGLLEMELPPIPIYGSTQCHITSPEKALFLEKAGFKRLILARELSLAEITAIREQTNVELESFIHGALCVSYSGQCYMSYAAGGRSGNRGECAQPCRKPYRLLDETGAVLAQDRFFLSLKDLNMSRGIGDLLDAGASSFKIEGRLKDSAYIRNVVSHYRRLLDAEMAARGMEKASSGRSESIFSPDPAKSFNRGFTEFFLRGKPDNPESPYTQKSVGEYLGKIAEVKEGFFILENPVLMHSGDGICFFDDSGNLNGMYIERTDGERIYPRDISLIRKGMELNRNLDKTFEKKVLSKTPERKLDVKIIFQQKASGFLLTAEDEDGITATSHHEGSFEVARNHESALASIEKQLLKTGGSIFRVIDTQIDWQEPMFVPVGVLNEARRALVKKLTSARLEVWKTEGFRIRPTSHPYPERVLSFEGNVLNDKAADFYQRHGVTTIEPAAESGLDMNGRRVMTTRHCIKRITGLCHRYPQEPRVSLNSQPEGALFLEDDRHKYRLEFACDRCEMDVFLETP